MKTIGRFAFLLLLFCSSSATYADTFGSDANTFDIEFVTISFRVASIALPEPERCCWGRWRPWDCRGGDGTFSRDPARRDAVPRRKRRG